MSDTYVDPALTGGDVQAGEGPRAPLRQRSSLAPDIYIPGVDMPGSFGRAERAKAGKPDVGEVMTPAEIEAQRNRDATAAEQEKLRILREGNAGLEQGYAAQEANLSRPHEPIPHLNRVDPNPPDQREYTKNSMGFMAAMVLTAMFSNKTGGLNATDALNNFSAASQGWQTGNLQAYDAAVKKWEQSNNAILKNNEMMLKEYDMILADRSLTTKELAYKTQIAAARLGDNLMYNQAVTENLNGIAARRDKLWDATYGEKGVQAAAAAFKPGQARFEAWGKSEAERAGIMSATDYIDPRNGQPYIKPSTGKPYSDADKQMDKYLIGRFPPGFSSETGKLSELQLWQRQHPNEPIENYWKSKALSHPPRNAPAMYMQKFMEENPEAGSKEIRQAMAIYNMTQARMRALGVREANVSVAINEAERTAKLAQEASDKVPRGPWVMLNEIREKVRKGTSSPEQKAFDIANASLITAYAQTMSRTGVNTVHAQQRAEHVLLTADGPEAYRAGIQMLLREANTVKSAVRDTYREFMEEGGSAEGIGGGGGGTNPEFQGKSDAEVLEAAGFK